MRRVPRPSESGCKKSRGEIGSLAVHQTGGKRLVSRPMYIGTCLQPKKKTTKVHHKVSKNAFKVGEAFLHCLKSGRSWICFDFQLYFPPNLTKISCQSSPSIASKVGEHGFVSIFNYCISHQISLTFAVASSLCGVEQQCCSIAVYSVTGNDVVYFIMWTGNSSRDEVLQCIYFLQ